MSGFLRLFNRKPVAVPDNVVPIKPEPIETMNWSANQKRILNLWQTCQPDLSRAQEFADLASSILQNKARYAEVGLVFRVPFWVIGCLHYREASFNFSTHLSNGDPLFDHNGHSIATTHVPQGLGPFTSWEGSARASLVHVGWNLSYHWDLVNALENIEAYNGRGYVNAGLNSPYIWAGTNHYKMGKYGSDGHYDPNLIDQQAGCAPILLALRSQGINLNEVF